MSINYDVVYKDLIKLLGESAVSNDPVRRFAWSTDASYFRIVPEIVVHADNLEQAKHTLAIARAHKVPVTFRAAGTSLSGQAIGDGILLILGHDGFRTIEVSPDSNKITLGAAVIGSDANAALKPLNKKIGPDPATLTSAMVGGIVSNNASGMCCGTAQNSYQTIASVKLLFADGTELDTGCDKSKAAFTQSHGELLDSLTALAKLTRSNEVLAQRIRKKYSIKNTTGYSINSLVDFEDPFELINHLIVGAEGTLAFVEEVTYHTVDEAQFKASAMAVFFNMVDAASAIPPIIGDSVAAAELLDWASIKAVTGKKGMPDWLSTLPEGAAILLIESRANDAQTLENYTQDVIAKLSHLKTERPITFSSDANVYSKYWAMRSGLFPIIGGERPKGSSVIIEDVAFNVEHLAEAAADLTALFNKHGYPEGVIYGHALAGNFHFIITPTFASQADIERFQGFMQDVAEMVIHKYDGSMKAEHGTGRAVAPFVEMEWGADAYTLMKRIKHIFDPEGMLNPGVILNDDSTVHVKNIKPCPVVDDFVDKCIECGFCEKTCPTSALNFSPRQRIATLREIERLEQSGDKAAAAEMRAAAKYDVVDTCAACQLCTIACPVDNSMGQLVRKLRTPYISTTEQKVLDFQAKHFGAVNQVISSGFDMLGVIHKITGDGITSALMKTGRLISKEVPYWNPDFPKGGKLPKPSPAKVGQETVVYFPACGGRTFGPTPKDPDNRTLPEVVVTLLERAGYNVITPEKTRDLCCGQMWESKGDFKNADAKRQELIDAVSKMTNGGKLPVVVDALSCTYRTLSGNPKVQIIDLVEFMHDNLLTKLNISKKVNVALHLGCSARKMKLEPKMQAIADACSMQVLKPAGIDCCGYAGEKGLYKPEINASALRNIKKLIPVEIKEGYYANRMCEVGLTQHSGISYRHLAYLLEECSR
ncbi:FAD-binding and (Fe-S)-binding domain-containing protein [Shewanella baltica]|uniref:D-lactate dehydrogenase (cytochrome) n=1 Tax=Shewanella baltica (strain OS155 / ATCC BAA-1091) TaxID=325240 RepID=A3D2A8_SHEB5|nr:FAD-binding and (Fe-S)-binding domain-containing protein [Shewanella baltica]ABN60871.1 FAD linked oxidase domain protein [Shewanella baltica OS155]AEH13220.1 D-lactate dehydrogenase (cytochrome) [Shewanella baltica OS117]MCS6099371.1 FAD-binding oxidoreductase [Shewanella baltica]MCS6182562.1 FAD-binding oxidoreductase [Shewanella baltica]MCS6190953.1 FAD-binding oxidoreductase [Shewanella baltica]